MTIDNTPSNGVNDDAEARLDQAFATVRGTATDPSDLAAARGRAWQGISASLASAGPSLSLSGCADYRGLIGAALAGELPSARKRLFEDHMQGCVECQAALRTARGQRPAAALRNPHPLSTVQRGWWPSRRSWALAAGFLLVLGLTGWATGTLTPSRVLAQVQSWQRQLVSELARLRTDLNALPRPELRRTSTLAAALPADTVLYVALPNLSGTMAQADVLLKQRIQESPVLKQWWEQNLGRGQSQAEMDRVMVEIAQMGGYLGDEIVLALSLDADGTFRAPLVLAETKDAAGLRKALDLRLAQAATTDADPLPQLQVLTDRAALTQAVAEEIAAQPVEAAEGQVADTVAPALPAMATSDEDKAALVWIADGRVILSPSAKALEALLDPADSPRFNGTALQQALSRAYAEGVNTVIGVDLERIMAARAQDGAANEIEATNLLLGMASARHLIVTERSQSGTVDLRAELTFSKARQGMSAWLAEPSDLGALDFFSPEAHLAVAGVTEQPATILSQLLQLKEENAHATTPDDAAAEHCSPAPMDSLQAMAAAADGEFAFALDGPVLPRPSWTLAMKMRDGATFQKGLDQLLDCFDLQARAAAEGQVVRETGRVSGRAVGSVRIDRAGTSGDAAATGDAPSIPISFHYLIEDGYFVAASETGILDRALRNHSSGVNLRASGAFRKLLPADLSAGKLRASALLYQNLGAVAQPLAQAMQAQAAKANSSAPDTGSESLAAFTADDLPPGLLLASAGADRVTLRGQATGAGIGSLLIGSGLLLGEGLPVAVPDTN